MKKSLLVLLATIIIVAGSFAQNNYVLNFNGTGNYVNLGSNAGNGLRSVEFWFKAAINYNSALAKAASMICRNTNDAGEVGEFGIYIGPSVWPGTEGRICFTLNGATNIVVSDDNSWPAGTWHHVACVINSVTGMEMYIDGVKQADSDLYFGSTNNRSEITTIGQWGNLADRYFTGAIDEVRFWNRSLTQTEIQQKMCLTLNPSAEAGLVGYWKMNEGSGTLVNDATTNVYNGTIAGATFALETYCFAGIAEDNAINSLSISPNPFNLSATLQFTKALNNADVTIYSMDGKEIRTLKSISGDKIKIDRDNLPNGVYFISVTQGNKTIATERFEIVD